MYNKTKRGKVHKRKETIKNTVVFNSVISHIFKRTANKN